MPGTVLGTAGSGDIKEAGQVFSQVAQPPARETHVDTETKAAQFMQVKVTEKKKEGARGVQLISQQKNAF